MNNKESLKTLLIKLLHSTYSYKEINSVIDICFKISLSYLKYKQFKGTNFLDKFGLTPEDIAYDSIAELFIKNNDGLFIELYNYFKDIDLISIDEETLFSHLRRLVFSKTNNRIFKIHNTFNPGLSKILRNIKRVVRQSSKYIIVEYFEEQVITIVGYDIYNDHLPNYPPELFSIELLTELTKSSTINNIIEATFNVLTNQNIYKKSYPVFELAIIIESYYGNSEISEDLESEPEQYFSRDEQDQFINRVLRVIEANHISGYIKHEKINTEEKNYLLMTLKDILNTEFFSDDLADLSYYDLLKNYIYQLTKDEYKNKYKIILEYLAKSAKGEMKTILIKEL